MNPQLHGCSKIFDAGYTINLSKPGTVTKDALTSLVRIKLILRIIRI